MNRARHLLLVLTLSTLSLVSAQEAAAFCGFYVSGATKGLYNDATQVVLLRDGLRTVQSMQNAYQGPPQDFAMVVPVPVVLKKEEVKTLPADLLARVDELGSPRLVEYWEQDPCPKPVKPSPDDLSGIMSDIGGKRGAGAGTAAAPPSGWVEVRASFAVGEYTVEILESNDAATLERWLRDHRYNIPAGVEPALRPYIEQGLYFFVAKVDVKKVRFAGGRAVLSPLRFHYDDKRFFLPVRLGLINAKAGDPQDLIIHVLARGQRYEAANLPNATIPTNIDVADAVRKGFPAFYNALFDKTLEKHPGAMITEYSWDAASCDPCPGPTLSQADLLTLGADALPEHARGGFTLTRLHARYTADTLRDDITLQAAPPITGGREVWVDTNELESGARPAGFNNFQARYAIRHLWTGPITCASPRRGVWGGPPAGHGAPPTAAARGLSTAPRGAKLTASLRAHVPELGLQAEKVTRDVFKKK